MNTFVKMMIASTLALSATTVSAAGSHITGDYINAKLLGSTNDRMIGSVIDSQFIIVRDYPIASALSFLLMATILVLVTIYVRRAGTEDLL